MKYEKLSRFECHSITSCGTQACLNSSKYLEDQTFVVMSFESLLVRGLRKGSYVWDENKNCLKFVPVIPDKKPKPPKGLVMGAFNGLTFAALKVNIKFRKSITEEEQQEFKQLLRHRNRYRQDCVVTIQDVKRVAVYLCQQTLPNLFLRFYNVWKVNQLLRACIIYMQFFLKNCETIVKTQHLLRAIPESGRTTTYQAMKEDLDDLRVLIGRFYSGVVLSELSYDSSDISQTDEILLFEYFQRVSSRVVWIALGRKYLTVIKVELGRIFRSGLFNNFDKNEDQDILTRINPVEVPTLLGKLADANPGDKPPDRLKTTSPIVHNFIRMDEPQLVVIRPEDFNHLRDDRLRFLTNYIFKPETDIDREGVTIGILGKHRRLYDCLLFPLARRKLKLLYTSSPMDISAQRTELRGKALELSMVETEPDTPHIFNHLSRIPRPGEVMEESIAEEVEWEGKGWEGEWGEVEEEWDSEEFDEEDN